MGFQSPGDLPEVWKGKYWQVDELAEDDVQVCCQKDP